MAQSLDIQDVIQKSTSQVSLKDLTRKGFKHVKVLNQATIQRLIVEAVDRVIDKRRDEISASERQKVIEESKAEFNTLASKRTKEQAESAKLGAENEALRSEAELLRKRVDGAMEVQAERDQALRQQESLESTIETLRGECTGKDKEVARLEARLEERDGADDANRCSLNEQVESLRERLSSSEKTVAKYEGRLDAKNEEIERLGQSTEDMFAKVSADLQARLETISVSSGADDDLRKSLEGIQQSIAGISSSGGRVRRLDETDVEAMVRFAETSSDDTDVESNIAQVKVRQAKAGGLKSALAKLKELQKGAQNDGE
jgi:chromosome segregation ATPase